MRTSGGEAKITVGARQVDVSNLDKVLFPGPAITKADVIAHYRAVARLLLPHARDRALTLHRFPDGIAHHGFIQQRRSEHFPDWIGSVTVPRVGEKGGEITHVVCNDEATLVYLANQGVIALHGWLSRSSRIGCPDRLIFDLDPPKPGAFGSVAAAAQRVRRLMLEVGLTPFVMTTGSKGLHVVAPLDATASFDDVRDVARVMAAALANQDPDALTTEQRKDKRRGRLYLDVSRNAWGQTSVLPYSLRALPNAPVAMPLEWSELKRKGAGPRRFTLESLRPRLAQRADPWADIERHAASLERIRDALDRALAEKGERRAGGF